MEKTFETFVEVEVRTFLSKFLAKDDLDIGVKAFMLTRSSDDEFIEKAYNEWQKYLDNESKSLKPSIELLMSHDPTRCGTSLYKKLRTWLQKYSKNTVTASGHYPDTNQVALCVSFDKRIPFKKQTQILDFIPLIKPIQDGEYKRISICEKTLSEFGSYDIRLYSDNDVKIIEKTYGIESTVQEFTNVLDALQYVWENLYYNN